MRKWMAATLILALGFMEPAPFASAQEPIISIGQQITVARPGSGGAPEFIGIADATLDDSGRVFALDALQHVLGVFNPDGSWLTGIGPAGVSHVTTRSLSGERLSSDRDNAVFILDRQPGHVERQRLVGRALRNTDSFSLKAPAGDLCVSGSEVFFIGSAAPNLISRYTASGRYLTSLGQPFSENEGLSVATSVASGMIACQPASSIVAVASRMLPEIRAYSSSGSLLWKYRIPDFHSVRTSELPDGGYELALNGPADVVERVFALKPFFVVQVTRGSPQRRSGGESGLETVVLDAVTGQQVSRQTDLPLIHSVRNGLALVIANDPEALAVVYALRVKASKK